MKDQKEPLFQFQQIARILDLAPTTVTRVMTHFRPSIDDVVTLANFLFHGNHLFPGIDTAEIEFAGRDEIKDRVEACGGDPVALLVDDQTLVFGMAGMLDEHEHPINGHVRAENESAATLVAKLTGMELDPHWAKVRDYGLRDDLGKRTDFRNCDASWSLPNLLKSAYRVDADNISWALQYAVNFVECYYVWLKDYAPADATCDDWTLETLVRIASEVVGEDADWLEDAEIRFTEARGQDLERIEEAKKLLGTVKFTTMKGGPKGDIVVAFAKNDIENFHDIVFKNSPAQVVAMRRTNGHYQILSRSRSRVRLHRVAGELRKVAFELNGEKVPDRKTLHIAGDLAGVYYFNPVLNDLVATETLTDDGTKAPPKISDREFVKAIMRGLDPKFFPKKPKETSDSAKKPEQKRFIPESPKIFVPHGRMISKKVVDASKPKPILRKVISRAELESAQAEWN